MTRTKNVNRNRTVIITGAAGGLGSALVEIFLDNDYQVIAADYDSYRLSDLPKNERLICRKLDVTDHDQVRSFLEDPVISETNLDVLVCAAGIYDTFPVTEADPGLLRRTLDVNLFGTVNMVQAFSRRLIANRGRVIVVTSESYKVQAMFQPYMISKAALEAYCHTARQELGLKGVGLSVIRPGAINTRLLSWMNSAEFTEKYPLFKSELKAGWVKSIRMVGRKSPPQKVAAVILKAASARRPKMVYLVNNSKLLRLISLLPKSLIDKLAIWMFQQKE